VPPDVDSAPSPWPPQVKEVIGIDLTPAMLSHASQLAEQRGLSNIEFQEGDAEALPFPDDHFDIITCRISAHHFSSPFLFLAESWRVLVKGGSFLLADTCSPDGLVAPWQNEVEVLRDPSHVRNFTPSQWQEAMQKAVFTISEFSTDYRSQLEFGDWVRRAGCSPEAISHLLQRFEQAPPR